MPSATHFLND